MILADKFAYINRMADVHPNEKIGLVFLMFAATFISSSTITLLCITAIMASILLVKAEIPAGFLFKLYALPLFFLVPALTAVAIQPMELTHALWGMEIGGLSLGVNDEGLIAAIFLGIRVIGAISCFYFLILTTPITDILLFLKKLHMPELFLELTSMTYRFIFLVLDTSEKIRISQESRLGNRTIKNRFRSLAALLTNLLVLTMNRSDGQYHAMEARCYDGSFHLIGKQSVFSKANILSIAVIAGSLIFIEIYTGGAA